MKLGSTTLVHSCSPQFLQAIGDVTVSYANLQWTLELVICPLLEGLKEEKRGVVTSNLSFSQLTELLDALYIYHELKSVSYDRFAEVLKGLEVASTELVEIRDARRRAKRPPTSLA